MAWSSYVGQHSDSPDKNAKAIVGLVFIKMKAFSLETDDAMALKSKIQLTRQSCRTLRVRLTIFLHYDHAVNMPS